VADDAGVEGMASLGADQLAGGFGGLLNVVELDVTFSSSPSS
jgi:hypothetical protein